MIKSVESALAEYKEQVKLYTSWLEGLKGIHGSRYASPAVMGSQDYDKMVMWGARLAGWEEALGLTKQEIAQINRELGIAA